MSRQLIVFIGGVRAGVLECEVRSSRFTYDEAYQARRAPTPLSLSLPVGPRTYPPSLVDPFLWGLLPDNPDTLRRWALLAEPHADEHSPFTLLEHYGLDCAGAVQFVAPGDEAILDRPGDFSPVSDEDIARQIRAMNADPSTWTFDEHDGRFSLGGAQAKFGLLRQRGHWVLPTGAVPSTHILKPGIPSYRASALNEHVCLELAHRLGLIAARSQIGRFEGEIAVIVERYDRYRPGDDARTEGTPEPSVVRIHQEDFCQALSVMPSQKYEDDGGPGLPRMVALLRRHLPRDLASSSIERLLLAVAFNWLVAAPDAHAKNYSILLARGQVALAPLYDIASLTPYSNYRASTMRLAQKVAGEYRVAEIGAAHWRQEAHDHGLDPDDFATRVEELVVAAPRHIEEICTDRRLLSIDPDFVATLRAGLQNRVASASSSLR